MPTVILLDVSLSMCRTVATQDTNEILSAKQLAIYGLNILLDYMSTNCKLELTSLMLFSSLWERNVGFTRDYEQIKTALSNLDAFYDKTNIYNALNGVRDLIHQEWGTNVPCNIILVTDGNPGISSYSDLDTNEKQSLAFNFPAKLHVVCVCDPAEQLANRCVSFYKRILEMAMPKKDINSSKSSFSEYIIVFSKNKLIFDEQFLFGSIGESSEDQTKLQALELMKPSYN